MTRASPEHLKDKGMPGNKEPRAAPNKIEQKQRDTTGHNDNGAESEDRGTSRRQEQRDTTGHNDNGAESEDRGTSTRQSNGTLRDTTGHNDNGAESKVRGTSRRQKQRDTTGHNGTPRRRSRNRGQRNQFLKTRLGPLRASSVCGKAQIGLQNHPTVKFLN